MRKWFLLIPLVVLISGCEDKDAYENYDISFREFGRDINWSNCVRRELSKNTLTYNNPLYNKSIDILCVRRSINEHRRLDKDLKENFEKDKKE
jgi:hypothetical protein